MIVLQAALLEASTYSALASAMPRARWAGWLPAFESKHLAACPPHLQPRSHHRLAARCPTPGREWKRARVAPPTLSPRRLPWESSTASSALRK